MSFWGGISSPKQLLNERSGIENRKGVRSGRKRCGIEVLKAWRGHSKQVGRMIDRPLSAAATAF
jgi:hypothetical protein